MKKELLIAALGISVTGALDAATRQEVEALLDKIAQSPVPKNLSDGASCYSRVFPPERIEYVCPVCETKTLYKWEESKIHTIETSVLIHYELSFYRKQCETLRKLGWEVKLDESFLCSKCRKPDRPEELFLEVTIDGKTTRTKLEDYDLNKLIAFAEKKLVWGNDTGGTEPLKDALPRIRELLGMPEEKSK